MQGKTPRKQCSNNIESCLIDTVETSGVSKKVLDWRTVKGLPDASDKSVFFEETELKLPEKTKYNINDLDEEKCIISSQEVEQERTEDTILKATQDFINTPIPTQWRM